MDFFVAGKNCVNRVFINILNITENLHSKFTSDNDIKNSYSTQLKYCYLMTTFRCPSDIIV